MFEELHIACVEFLDALVSKGFSEIDESREKIQDIIEMDRFEIESYIYENVSYFLNTETSVFITDGKTQKKEKITFYDLLLDISQTSVHQEPPYSCDFHQETLLSHLTIAFLTSLKSSTENHVQNSILALFHDVGKYSTTVKYHGNMLGYPFHGEMGAGIMLKMWTPQIEPIFTKKEWGCMCRAIGCHMCGYHCQAYESYDEMYKLDLLKAEDKLTKYYLTQLSYADKLSGFPKMKEDLETYIKFRPKFRKIISRSFDLKKFMGKYNMKGIAVFLCGVSGSGKTTLFQKCKDYLINLCVPESSILHVERDQIICNQVSKRLGLGECLTKVHGKKYEEFYRYYKENKLSDEVNRIFSRKISDGLRNDKIVFIDTVASYFKAAEFMLPDTINCAFKIANDCIRSDLVDDATCERMNKTLQEQLNLIGDITVLNWLPKGCFAQEGPGNLKNLSPHSTKHNVEKLLVKDKVSPNIRVQATFEFDDQVMRLMDMISNLEFTMEDTTTDNMHLHQLINYLLSSYNWDYLVSFFKEKLYTANAPSLFKDTDIEALIVKYLEHNHLYHPWARHCRGTVFINTKNGIRFVKSLLQRGVEILIPVHIKKGVTENENSAAEYLDEDQKRVIDRCLKGEKERLFVTFKNDGSLMGVNLYPTGLEETKIIRDAIEEKRDLDEKFRFAHSLISKAESMGLDFMPVISTQGTLVAPNNMLDFIVTAIACGMFDFDTEYLRKASSLMTPTMFFDDMCSVKFLDKMKKFRDACPEDVKRSTMCLSFEAVCPNRTSAWNGSHFTPEWEFNLDSSYNGTHLELAIATETASCEFLGATFNVGETTGNFRAHFQIPSLVKSADLTEPLWWDIDDTKTLNSMINSISDILKGNLTEEEFFDLYKPQNYEDTKRSFHYEGFVVYNITKNNRIGIDEEYDFDINYSKVKTTEYYIGHRFKTTNIPALMNLSESADNIIPLVKNVKNFFGNLEDTLYSLADKKRDILTRCCENIDSMPHILGYLDENPKIKMSLQKKLENKDHATVHRMIINTSPGWKEHVFEMFRAEFNIEQSDETHSVVKKIVMRIEPWNDEYKKNIRSLIENRDDSICELFAITCNP